MCFVGIAAPILFAQSLTIGPNPLLVTDGSSLATAEISWNAVGHQNVNVYIGSNGGQLFASGGPTGSAYTGKWVTNGMKFVLADAGSKATLGTAVAQVAVATASCGSMNPLQVVAVAGTTVNYTYTDSANPTSVSFQIDADKANPNSATLTVAGTKTSASSWNLAINTGGLAVLRITPLVSYGGAAAIACRNVAFLNVQSGIPTPVSPGCPSMSGNGWTATSAGDAGGVYSANLSENSSNYITGTATTEISQADCGTAATVSWTVKGTYSPAAGMNIFLTNPSPSQIGSCIMANPINETTSSQGIGPSPYCGMGESDFTSTFPLPNGGSTTVSGTTSWSRGFLLPPGESSSFSTWAGAYGQPTNAEFYGTIAQTDPTDIPFSYVGDWVMEYSTTTGTDGCLTGANDPFPQVTSVTGGAWYIQQNNLYGPDAIGYGGNVVAWLQNYALSRLPCNTNVPQQMQIRLDNYNPSGTTPYGSLDSGNSNQLTITVSSTGLQVMRAQANSGFFYFYF